MKRKMKFTAMLLSLALMAGLFQTAGAGLLTAEAADFSNRYGSDMYRIFNAQCSAEKMYASYGEKIYICQVDYDETTLGSFHGIFLPMLTSVIGGFASFGDFGTAGYSGMAAKFDRYLASFLHTGNPNGQDTGAGWTCWTPADRRSMIFDGDENGGIAEMRDVSSSYAAIIRAMKADTSISEDVKMQLIRTVMNGRWFSAEMDRYFRNPSLWK